MTDKDELADLARKRFADIAEMEDDEILEEIEAGGIAVSGDTPEEKIRAVRQLATVKTVH